MTIIKYVGGHELKYSNNGREVTCFLYVNGKALLDLSGNADGWKERYRDTIEAISETLTKERLHYYA